MYPIQNRVVAIGDLHGDLRVTLMALRLAGAIGSDIYPHNVSDIQWLGGQTYVVQLGDQIDRCRPSDWIKNCIDKLDGRAKLAVQMSYGIGDEEAADPAVADRADVASKLELTPNGLKTLLQRSRQLLRSCLERAKK